MAHRVMITVKGEQDAKASQLYRLQQLQTLQQTAVYFGSDITFTFTT